MKYTTNLPQKIAEGSNENSFFPNGERAVLISITSPDDPPAQIYMLGWKDVLRVSFYDVTSPVPDLRNHTKTGATFDPINEEQAKNIAEFIKKHFNENIIVHCRAGVSRSAAISRLLTELGWTTHSFRVHDFSKFNVTVYNMVKKHFPELLPIGA